MKYSKKIMSMKELHEECNYPITFLRRAYIEPGQTFAFRKNPNAKNSPIVFDTDGLEQYRLKQIKSEQRAMRREYAI